ncbi:MAG: hypothetical protein IPM23_05705 [Candidatus Melainabacteria bacterium]|nr:hypothetical protein [Candidatus Melainabacteria bacterium]
MTRLSVFLLCLALSTQGRALAQDSGRGSGAGSGSSAGDIAGITDCTLAEPAGGPLLPLRKQLREQIVEAEKRGVGIKSYAEAFSSLEEQVVRQKLRANPLPGIDPDGPGSLKDDARLKRHLQGK